VVKLTHIPIPPWSLCTVHMCLDEITYGGWGVGEEGVSRPIVNTCALYMN
jgi:hypothetical protein